MTPPPSPEFLLLAACCRWPRSPEAVRAAANDAILWPRFLRLVRRHRVQGLAHAAIQTADVRLPEPAASNLAKLAREQARLSLLYASDTANIAALLEEADIAPLFFKGPTLAQRIYGDLAIKQTGDVDLLIHPTEARHAVKTLEAAGHRRLKPDRDLSPRQFDVMLAVLNGVTFRHEESGRLVDLHWRLTTNPLLFKPSAGAERVMLAGAAIRTLGRSDLALYLAAHGSGHNWARLKWLADFNALLFTMSHAEIEVLRERARHERLSVCFEAALALCQRILGGLPDMEPKVGKRVNALLRLTDNMMRGPDETAEQLTRPGQGVLQATAATFMQKSGLRYQAINIWLASFKRDDALSVPLRRPLMPLYLVIGPAMRAGRNLGRLTRLASRRARSKATQPHQP